MAATQDSNERFTFGGRLALDFTWTLRYRAITPTELIPTPADLDDWFVAAGLLDGPGRSTPTDHAAAIALREAIYAAAAARIDGATIPPPAISTINRHAAEPGPMPQLASDGGSVVHRTRPGAAAVLGEVARDAIDVLVSVPPDRLRQCEGPMCSLLFVDSSRPGKRRWCSALTCGNRVNTRSYRARNR
jgi:predicted RNA-binding Zn ribbon-like protein